jgi:hypothetical protein
MWEHRLDRALTENPHGRRRDMIQKLFLGILVFAFSACASAPTKSYHTNDNDSRAYMEISFPSDLAEPDDFAVANETDARSLVTFALKLEKKLKFVEAATFFHEAADLQEKGAPASRFRLSCLGAAAVCWLKAGEDEQFHGAVSNIRDELDRFQQADLPDQFSVLIAISDKLKGRSPSLNPALPQPVKTLFDDPRRMP